MLWLDMGLGKTSVALTSFIDLQDRWEVSAALVVGPLRVVESVWQQEAEKWEHTTGLRFSLIHGNEAHRKAALNRRADIYLTNYENLEWLVTWIRHQYLGKNRYPPFDMLIYDEITKVKNAQAKRSEAIQHILPFMRRRVGLTGEPAANGYMDLHGQYLAVDGGKRLGQTITSFRGAFLQSCGFMGKKYKVTPYGKQQIKERVSDITLEMSSIDYLDLPPVVERDIVVDLPPKARTVYEQVEKEFFAELDAGGTIEAQTEAAKGLKCLQVAGGAAYVDDSHNWAEIHGAKLDALEDLLEEQAGSPVLLAYAFRHEAARIAKRFPKAKFLSSELSGKEFNATKKKFSQGEIPLLCGHPASMGHGVDGLQDSCFTLCWYGLNWSLEKNNQFNARIIGGHRRKKVVTIHRILARDTMDYAVKEALEGKATTQTDLKAAVRAYRNRKRQRAA